MSVCYTQVRSFLLRQETRSLNYWLCIPFPWKCGPWNRALSVSLLERQSLLAAVQTSWIRIFIVTGFPRWLLRTLRLAKCCVPWRLLYSPLKNVGDSPNVASVSVTFSLILVFSLMNTASIFKHRVVSLYRSPFPHQYSSFLGVWIALFFAAEMREWLKDLTGSVSEDVCCGSPRAVAQDMGMPYRALPLPARLRGLTHTLCSRGLLGTPLLVSFGRVCIMLFSNALSLLDSRVPQEVQVIWRQRRLYFGFYLESLLKCRLLDLPPELLVQYVWVGAWQFVFFTNSWVKLMLLVRSHTLRTAVLEEKKCIGIIIGSWNYQYQIESMCCSTVTKLFWRLFPKQLRFEMTFITI